MAAITINNGNSTEEAPTTSTQQKGSFLTGQSFGGQTTGGGENAVAQVLTETKRWLAFKQKWKYPWSETYEKTEADTSSVTLFLSGGMKQTEGNMAMKVLQTREADTQRTITEEARSTIW